jgi:short-subunit dehydrogenase
LKKILVTGASSGIGYAIAQALVEHGHEVWGTSRDLARLPDWPRFHPVRLDLADYASVQKAFETAWEEAGGLDVLINNAGSGHFGSAESLEPGQIEEFFRILVFAQIELCRFALLRMKARGAGLLINVSSLASRLPVPYMAAYNSAKAALASYTFSLQLELPDPAVQVVDLQPADICTNFNDVIARQPSSDPRIEKVWKAVDRNMRDAPKPDLVALRVLHLIEKRNSPHRLTIGDSFQSRVAPLIFRLLPQRVRIWGLKKYYGI